MISLSTISVYFAPKGCFLVFFTLYSFYCEPSKSFSRLFIELVSWSSWFGPVIILTGRPGPGDGTGVIWNWSYFSSFSINSIWMMSWSWWFCRSMSSYLVKTLLCCAVTRFSKVWIYLVSVVWWLACSWALDSCAFLIRAAFLLTLYTCSRSSWSCFCCACSWV